MVASDGDPPDEILKSGEIATLVQITPGSTNLNEVEPGATAAGNLIFSVFQADRATTGSGAARIGFAHNGAGTWTQGTVPGLTTGTQPPYTRATDPTVAYDLKHNTWMIGAIAWTATAPNNWLVTAIRGTSAGFQAPVVVASSDGIAGLPGRANLPNRIDKPWVVCNSLPATGAYGYCWIFFHTYSLTSAASELWASYTGDGGVTWAGPVSLGQSGKFASPIIMPSGNPALAVLSNDAAYCGAGQTGETMSAVIWTGSSWIKETIATGVLHRVAPAPTSNLCDQTGAVRADALPSMAADSNGGLYVAWSDCRYRTNCGANDVVVSWRIVSGNTVTWSTPTRPFVSGTTVVNSTANSQLTPSLAAARTAAGNRFGLTYYELNDAACANTTASPCTLDAKFTSFAAGDSGWSTPVTLNNTTMPISWFPLTGGGYMFGDYVSTVFVPDANNAPKAFPIVSLATAAGNVKLHSVSVGL
jgi:hypothetical protein